jgi:hypothetical protein
MSLATNGPISCHGLFRSAILLAKGVHNSTQRSKRNYCCLCEPRNTYQEKDNAPREITANIIYLDKRKNSKQKIHQGIICQV